MENHDPMDIPRIWFSIVSASIVCGFQLGVSAIFPFDILVTIPTMVIWHSIIGIGEAAITVTAIIAIAQKGPQFQIRLPKNNHTEGK